MQEESEERGRRAPFLRSITEKRELFEEDPVFAFRSVETFPDRSEGTPYFTAFLLHLFPEHAFLRDEQGERQIVRLAGDTRQTLRLEGCEDRLRARAARKIAVIVAAAAAETISVLVKGRAGDEHGVELLRRETARDGRVGLRDREASGDELSAGDIGLHPPVRAAHGEGKAHSARGERFIQRGEIALAADGGIAEHGPGFAQLRQGREQASDPLAGRGALPRAQRVPPREGETAQLFFLR